MTDNRQEARPETLSARGVTVDFDGMRALDDIGLTLDSGEILGLIGPNGAGKTTLVNVLTGLQPPTGGEVLLGDRDVTSLAPSRRARAGIGRTFQAVRLFPNFSIFENIYVAATMAGLRGKAARRRAWEVLERTHLRDRARELGGALPHGEERRVGIARALAADPSFLLLDEPAAGLNERESDELLETLRTIGSEFSLGLLVIEHDMRLIMRLCGRIQVLDYGVTLATGTPEEIQSDPRVLRAYLGDAPGVEHA